MDGPVKDFLKIIVHTVLGFLLLAVWLFAAWIVDDVLLTSFPIRGASMIGFRLLEVILHVSTLRFVFRTLMEHKREKGQRWWI